MVGFGFILYCCSEETRFVGSGGRVVGEVWAWVGRDFFVSCLKLWSEVVRERGACWLYCVFRRGRCGFKFSW